MFTLILQFLIIIAQSLDRLQTRYILLGEHPTLKQVDAYFIVCIVGSVLSTICLRPELRFIWQVGNLLVQAGFVIHNARIGIKLWF